MEDVPKYILNLEIDLKSTCFLLGEIQEALNKHEQGSIITFDGARDKFEPLVKARMEPHIELSQLVKTYSDISTPDQQKLKMEWAATGKGKAEMLGRHLECHRTNLSFSIQLAQR